MDPEAPRYRTFSRRAALLAGAQGLLFTVLAGRLYYLGVIESDQYEMLAEDNRVSIRLLAPPRGEIRDRHGSLIATNRQDYRVFLIPEQARNIRETLERLGRIVPLDERNVARILRTASRQRDFLPVTVAEDLSWPDFAAINVAAPDLPGISPDAGLTRWYPHGSVASQLVGYVGSPAKTDLDGDPLLTLPGFRIGKAGLEKAYDRQLRGTAGSTRVEVNAYGRIVRELGRVPGDPGANLDLTLDIDLQKEVTARLGEESAGVVVMDIHSGDVYAYASTPSFDPNDFNLGISRENWQALLADPRKPLVDKCITGQYPPGSTIKPVVALAALAEGVIDPEETVYCNGRHAYGDNVWHCWRRRGHGHMTMQQAIARSCDVYFYTVAQRMGITPIADWLTRFGLGETYDLPVDGQSAGLVPTPAWSRAVRGQPWVGGETLNVGIGQGALLATPLQLAVMTARLANGGRAVTPRIVRPAGDLGPGLDGVSAARLDIPGEHLRIVQRSMEMVMEPRGTAWTSRLDMDGQRMAGKTGTAQVRRITTEQREQDIQQSELPWRDRHHAWFVAYAPTESPRYAVSVLIEHGGGGASAAAPVARDVVAATLRRNPALRRRMAGPQGSRGEET